MTNREKYNKTFIDCFLVTEDMLNKDFVYQCIQAWDSVGHMTLVAVLEDRFDIMLDTDDIIDMSSVAKAKEILKKYEVTL